MVTENTIIGGIFYACAGIGFIALLLAFILPADKQKGSTAFDDDNDDFFFKIFICCF